jgi:hypothetical protein
MGKLESMVLGKDVFFLIQVSDILERETSPLRVLFPKRRIGGRSVKNRSHVESEGKHGDGAQL